ncbi:hypothetical protein F2Q68_00002025 [Brassica cretica]|uniref:Uncharacterized protein n=1 Tax=Brassica cretica TaxID=69181 RepID=A0A8S9JN63_BRACR|nr:hypothetical protein F2Q68_00002025 [Brassica cretica]
MLVIRIFEFAWTLKLTIPRLQISSNASLSASPSAISGEFTLFSIAAKDEVELVSSPFLLVERLHSTPHLF